ncbi:MAG: hypothetical protein MUO35_01170 [Anaerolineales bacterium]|nr:hypothetical protein [Anaerolineales bacterium]
MMLVFLATSGAAFAGSVQRPNPAQGGDPRLEQLQAGWETYRLWCSACHAYSGEGLTPAWISTWAPDDQNCWQSKCHSLNHPDDGFVLPHVIPAIIGPGILDHFQDGVTLFGYVTRLMPYQEPGVLSDEQYYAVLAHVLSMNGIDYGNEPLGPENIAAVVLTSGPSGASPAAPVAESPAPPSMPPAASPTAAGSAPRPGVLMAGLLGSLLLASVAAVALALEQRAGTG